MGKELVTLAGKNSVYVLDVGANGVPQCRYWGTPFAGELSLEQFRLLQTRPVPVCTIDESRPVTLFPEEGLGFFGYPALRGQRNRDHWANQFTLKEVHSPENGVVFVCEDENAQLQLELEIFMNPDTDVLQRRSRLTNQGTAPYQVDWCAGAAFEIPSACAELQTFYGAWTKEFQTQRQPFPGSPFLRENRRGRTSHESFPALIAGTAHFGENQGEVYGFHLGWSGNHRLLAETLTDGSKQLQLGELLMPGEIVLQPRESYLSPWVYATYSAKGLNGMSQQFHKFARAEIFPANVSKKPRVVQFNSWEAIYFDHEQNTIRDLVRQAAQVGAERFVLDDGWFSGRNAANSSLGDWWPDIEKYPEGLAPLIQYVQSVGMEFGLWVEPEMVSPQSELYRKHPDWALHLENIPRLLGREQLVLNLGLPEVVDYLFQSVDALLREHSISYLKWDMNRDLATAGSHGKAGFHEQILGFYRLLERLREAHPDVEIESCAGGGGRIDLGVLQRTERVWASDSNDVLQRQSIQKGFSYFLPLEIMGSHIGPKHCHTTGRQVDLNFRAHTALFGHFGMEFDLRELSSEETEELKQHIAVYKEHRQLLHTGNFYRLESVNSKQRSYGVVSTDQSEALFCVAQLETPDSHSRVAIQIPGLREDTNYQVKWLGPLGESIAKSLPHADVWQSEGITVNGKVLEQVGIVVPLEWPQSSVLLQITKQS